MAAVEWVKSSAKADCLRLNSLLACLVLLWFGRRAIISDMTEHSVWRISLAHEIAPAFTAHPKVEACFVFGSVALGIADQYSDLELAFIWSQLPSAEELQAVAQSIGVEGWEIELYGKAKQAWLEQFYMYGMKVEAGHWARDEMDNIVTDVVERYDVSQNGLVFEKQATVSHLQRAVVLYGEDIIKHWQTRLSPYPEELAVAMVQKHLKFRPFDGQQILTERLEIPMLYENNCAIVRRLLNLLFGLNRIYHPGFKWTRYWIQQMNIKPPDFFERLERLFRSDAVSGTHELRWLVEETFDLIEQHLPQIDLKQQREVFNRTYPKWRLPVNG
jgi:predicted nucleotidyltransferase